MFTSVCFFFLNWRTPIYPTIPSQTVLLLGYYLVDMGKEFTCQTHFKAFAFLRLWLHTMTQYPSIDPALTLPCVTISFQLKYSLKLRKPAKCKRILQGSSLGL